MNSKDIKCSPVVAAISSADKLNFSSDILSAIREKALQQLLASGLPSRNSEAWRFFDTRPIERGYFAFADPKTSHNFQSLIDSVRLPESEGATAVVVNGVWRPDLSDLSALTGVSFRQFSDLSADEQRDLFAILERVTTPLFQEDPFVAMNLAAFQELAFLKVDKDAAPQKALHVIYLIDDTLKLAERETSDPIRPMAHPHLLVHAASGSKLTLIEEWLTDAKTPFINSLTQICLEESATLHHIRVQRENLDSLHIDRVAVLINGFSRYDACSYASGSLKARTDIRLKLAAPEAWARIDGVAIMQKKQEIDTHSMIDNSAPNVVSYQLHKMIAADEGHGIFNGKIVVRHGSQQIEANQLNRNLLLGNRARVDAKPELKIFADDVICSHGSATGQLDKEQLFYLETRGISPDEARATLTSAFAAEAIENIEIKTLKERLVNELFDLIQSNKDLSCHVE